MIMKEKCLRCGHTWIPRKKEKPKACPKCKSYGYDRKKGEEYAVTERGMV